MVAKVSLAATGLEAWAARRLELLKYLSNSSTISMQAVAMALVGGCRLSSASSISVNAPVLYNTCKHEGRAGTCQNSVAVVFLVQGPGREKAAHVEYRNVAVVALASLFQGDRAFTETKNSWGYVMLLFKSSWVLAGACSGVPSAWAKSLIGSSSMPTNQYTVSR